MPDFIRLTQNDGKAVQVNVGLVQYILPKGLGAEIVFTRLRQFSRDTLTVQEAPEAILALAETARR